jgi:hypothetical protein
MIRVAHVFSISSEPPKSERGIDDDDHQGRGIRPGGLSEKLTKDPYEIAAWLGSD